MTRDSSPSNIFFAAVFSLASFLLSSPGLRADTPSWRALNQGGAPVENASQTFPYVLFLDFRSEVKAHFGIGKGKGSLWASQRYEMRGRVSPTGLQLSMTKPVHAPWIFSYSTVKALGFMGRTTTRFFEIHPLDPRFSEIPKSILSAASINGRTIHKKWKKQSHQETPLHDNKVLGFQSRGWPELSLRVTPQGAVTRIRVPEIKNPVVAPSGGRVRTIAPAALGSFQMLAQSLAFMREPSFGKSTPQDLAKSGVGTSYQVSTPDVLGRFRSVLMSIADEKRRKKISLSGEEPGSLAYRVTKVQGNELEISANTAPTAASVEFVVGFEGRYQIFRRLRVELPSGRILRDVFELVLTPPKSTEGGFFAQVGYEVAP
jgi:hypothetical protein